MFWISLSMPIRAGNIVEFCRQCMLFQVLICICFGFHRLLSAVSEICLFMKRRDYQTVLYHCYCMVHTRRKLIRRTFGLALLSQVGGTAHSSTVSRFFCGRNITFIRWKQNATVKALIRSKQKTTWTEEQPTNHRFFVFTDQTDIGLCWKPRIW